MGHSQSSDEVYALDADPRRVIFTSKPLKRPRVGAPGPVFALFEQLPTELRRMVWEAALPCEQDGPSVYLYNKKFSDVFYEEKWELERAGQNRPGLWVEVDVPALMWVNREARLATADWARRMGYVVAPTGGPGGTYFEEGREVGYSLTMARGFDPRIDTVYVSAVEWEQEFSQTAFLLDPDEESDRPMYLMYEVIEHLALPAYTAYYGFSTVMEMVEYMPNLKTIAVVWDELPTPAFMRAARAAAPVRRDVTGSETEAETETETETDEDDDGSDDTDSSADTMPTPPAAPGRSPPRIEAVVQPRCDLELLDMSNKAGARMSVDGEDRTWRRRRWEYGVLEDYMCEMAVSLAISDLPGLVVEETGELRVDLVPVLAKRRRS